MHQDSVVESVISLILESCNHANHEIQVQPQAVAETNSLNSDVAGKSSDSVQHIEVEHGTTGRNNRRKSVGGTGAHQSDLCAFAHVMWQTPFSRSRQSVSVSHFTDSAGMTEVASISSCSEICILPFTIENWRAQNDTTLKSFWYTIFPRRYLARAKGLDVQSSIQTTCQYNLPCTQTRGTQECVHTSTSKKNMGTVANAWEGGTPGKRDKKSRLHPPRPAL